MAKGDESTTLKASNRPDFSLTIAARALAASTVAYLVPNSRGLSFAAYDAIVKTQLLPPFSRVVSADRCGRDVSNKNASRSYEQADCKIDAGEEISSKEEEGKYNCKKDNDNELDGQALDGDNPSIKDVTIGELQKRFNGDYELYEEYDRTGTQKVRCLVAVVHGKIQKIKDASAEIETETMDGMEFTPGSISIIFRGTDNLDNVLADVKAISTSIDEQPFIPDGHDAPVEKCPELERKMKKAMVHHGFRDAWHGDKLRRKILQLASDTVKDLHREIREAKRLGLGSAAATAPTIDVAGHSLGGSVAVLAAFDLARSLRDTAAESSNRAHVRVYTAGCPRVGNVRFARLFDELVPDCWNVINDNDIVPAIPHSPSCVVSRLPLVCRPCEEAGYRRHGRVAILKENGALSIDPSRRAKYRREAKVLRLKSAVDCHETSSYRENIRAVIATKIGEEKQATTKHSSSLPRSRVKSLIGVNECKQKADLEAFDNLLDQLGQVITEARSDPKRSFHILPGGT